MKNIWYGLIGALLIVGLLQGVCPAADTEQDALQYVGGNIPIIRKIEVLGPGYSDFFAGITADDYVAGFKASGEGTTTLAVTANTEWKVLVKATPFAPVEDYVKPASDLYLKITTNRHRCFGAIQQPEIMAALPKSISRFFSMRPRTFRGLTQLRLRTRYVHRREHRAESI